MELRDVVAVEIRHAQVQRAVAQMVGRVDERRPGLAVDLVGVGQSLLLAERAHGSDRRVVEHAGHGVFGKESGGDEPLLDVLDGRPRIVSFDRIHTRHTSVRPALGLRPERSSTKKGYKPREAERSAGGKRDSRSSMSP